MWVNFLGDVMTRRFFDTRIFDLYYRGDHRLPWGPTPTTSSVYRRLLKEARSNWAELIVDAVNERLRVIGFRWSGTEDADLDVWDNIKITAEHPNEVICYSPTSDRHLVTAALKRWCDDWGQWHATLFTTSAI